MSPAHHACWFYCSVNEPPPLFTFPFPTYPHPFPVASSLSSPLSHVETFPLLFGVSLSTPHWGCLPMCSLCPLFFLFLVLFGLFFVCLFVGGGVVLYGFVGGWVGLWVCCGVFCWLGGWKKFFEFWGVFLPMLCVWGCFCGGGWGFLGVVCGGFVGFVCWVCLLGLFVWVCVCLCVGGCWFGFWEG